MTSNWIKWTRPLPQIKIKNRGEIGCSGRIPVVLLLIQIRWSGMKMKSTGLWLWQTEHICDQMYLEMVRQIMIATSTEPIRAIGWVDSLLAVTIYQVIPDRNHKLKNMISTNVLIKRRMVMHMEYISLSWYLIFQRLWFLFLVPVSYWTKRF